MPNYRPPLGSPYNPYSKYAAMAAAASMGGAGIYGIGKKMLGLGGQAVRSYNQKTPTSKPKLRSYRPVSSIKPMKKKLKELSRLAEADQGTHIHRQRDTYQLLAGANAIGYQNYSMNDCPIIESVLSGLRYYDPSNPATLLNAAGATGTFHKDFYIKRAYSSATIRNNFQVPVKVSAYICRPKDDTSITPYTAFQNGLADVGNPSNVSPLVHLTDSPQFNDIWAIEKTVKCFLQPGQQKTVSHSVRPFSYDPSLFDSHALNYQKAFLSYIIFVRIEGVISHDTVAVEVGRQSCGVDIEVDRTFEVRYPAGADIKYIVVTDNSNSFTNLAVTSSKPVSDNQTYSVA